MDHLLSVSGNPIHSIMANDIDNRTLGFLSVNCSKLQELRLVNLSPASAGELLKGFSNEARTFQTVSVVFSNICWPFR